MPPTAAPVGWWDNLVGPGKPLDTNWFFVIGVNNLGGCYGSSGPNVSTRPPANRGGADFPFVTVEDWVDAQARWPTGSASGFAAVMGGSLGGMQALSWTLQYPERVAHALVIAAGAQAHRPEHRLQRSRPPGHPDRPEFHGGHFTSTAWCPRAASRWRG